MDWNEVVGVLGLALLLITVAGVAFVGWLQRPPPVELRLLSAAEAERARRRRMAREFAEALERESAARRLADGTPVLPLPREPR